MLIKSSPTYYMDIQATTCQDQLPQKNSSHTPPISLELFAGAGGLALGVHAAGFKLLGLVERDSFATETLRENSQRVLELEPGLVLEAEAEAVDYDQFAGRVDLLSGGPPCQPFSTGGRNRGASDKRNMFPVFLNAMATIRPKAILIENVKGLLRESFQDYYNYLLKRLQYPLHQRAVAESWYDHYQRLLKVENGCFTDDEQYTVTYQLVDSADFGIPQRRERVFIYAFRKDLGTELFQLSPTHSKEALLVDQWITGSYWERHDIEPVDYLNKTDRRGLKELRRPLIPPTELLPWKTVRDAISDLPEPVKRGEDEVIRNHLQHPGARVYPGHTGSYWDYPAKALKAGTHGTPGGENMLRVAADDDERVRYFTTREAARLQTFPDEWHFHGTWGACIKQLGNAVPVDLAELYATEIYRGLLNRRMEQKND